MAARKAHAQAVPAAVFAGIGAAPHVNAGCRRAVESRVERERREGLTPNSAVGPNGAQAADECGASTALAAAVASVALGSETRRSHR